MTETREDHSDKNWVSQVHAERIASIGGLIEYGSLTLKSLTLLHGGALVAIIALSGNIYERAKGSAFASFQVTLGEAASWFTAGLVLAVCGAGVGYLNFLFNGLGNSPMDLRDWYRGIQPNRSRFIRFSISATVYLGIACASLSAVFFIVGARAARIALFTLPPMPG